MPLKRIKNKYIRIILRLFPFLTEFDLTAMKKIENGSKIYIRYNGMTFRFYRELKKLKKRNCIIIIEIPTYPYDSEQTSLGRLLNYKDYIWRDKLITVVDRCVTYSRDDFIFGIPTIKISNCINKNNISKRNVITRGGNEVNAIAVAAFSRWHGYDRIIEGMKLYYEAYREVTFKLHLVGNGLEVENYKCLVKKYSLDRYVIFYGVKTGKDLNDIYDKCDVALDAMGRHRSGVQYNSSLKGKEYLAKGMPIVSGVETELDYDRKFKYYMRVSADESPVDIQGICNFINDLYSMEDIEKIASNIRKYAEDRYDISVAFNGVIQYLKS